MQAVTARIRVAVTLLFQNAPTRRLPLLQQANLMQTRRRQRDRIPSPVKPVGAVLAVIPLSTNMPGRIVNPVESDFRRRKMVTVIPMATGVTDFEGESGTLRLTGNIYKCSESPYFAKETRAQRDKRVTSKTGLNLVRNCEPHST